VEEYLVGKFMELLKIFNK
jgi:hypothetical protein